MALSEQQDNANPDKDAQPKSTALAVHKDSAPSGRLAEVIARNRKRLRLIGTGVSLALLALSVVVLGHTLTTLSWHDLREAFEATGADQIALAVLFTAISYIALTGYDALALRQLHLRVRYRITALASFTSYAISFTLGFPLITAGTVRYWIYSQAGVSAGRVASLTVIAGVTFWLGMAFVVGAALVIAPSGIAEINHLKSFVNVLIGIGVLVFIGGYLFWVSRGHRRTRIQGLTLELPGLGLTLGQLFLGVIDLCAAASVLYVLLPRGTEMDFISFAATYVFACLLGIASNAPGGIGAFELTMLKSVPAPSAASLFASLLLFRAIYYIVPFVLALALIGAHESMRRWNSLREAMTHSNEDDGGDSSSQSPG
jgi:uncharacterized membrane protein YbhN (UPF0104 family)